MHSGNIYFGGGKANININENRTYKEFFLGLLHHRLGHRSINSLMAGDTENVWKDIELRIDPDHFAYVRYL